MPPHILAVFNQLYEELKSMKQQQWTITNYGALILAARSAFLFTRETGALSMSPRGWNRPPEGQVASCASGPHMREKVSAHRDRPVAGLAEPGATGRNEESGATLCGIDARTIFAVLPVRPVQPAPTPSVTIRPLILTPAQGVTHICAETDVLAADVDPAPPE